jgi:uncharacterized protein YecT (DUF1311 family)
MKTIKTKPLFAALLALALILPGPAHASAQEPGWEPPGTEETAAVEEANKEIEKVYAALMKMLDEQGQKSLRDAQRSWIKWRDDEALLIARVGGAVGGSALRVDFLTAQADLIRERTEVLQSYVEKADDNN